MQLQFIPFKIGSLWSNTAIPALLPLFIVVEEVFTWDVVQSPRRSYLDVFNCPKIDVLWGGFELGELKEIARGQDRAVRWVGKSCDIILSQKFPHIGQFFSHVQIFCNDLVDVRFGQSCLLCD